MGKTNISWTDVSWNPVTGCSRVSEGCRSCYAEVLSLRRGWSKKPWTAPNAAENVVLHEDRLERPLHWKEPRMVFVNSMSDVFHERIGTAFVDKMFSVMALCPQHTFQVLTKRAVRMEIYMNSVTGERVPIMPWPKPNIWMGVSVEDQRRADELIPILLKTPAAVRWVSVEPLLEPVSFRWADWHHISRTRDTDHLDGLRDLDWVVVGGESGPGHRPMKIEWLESIVDECCEANVPVWVKQDSGARPGKQGRIPDELWALKQYPKVAT